MDARLERRRQSACFPFAFAASKLSLIVKRLHARILCVDVPFRSRFDRPSRVYNRAWKKSVMAFFKEGTRIISIEFTNGISNGAAIVIAIERVT